MEVCPRRPIDVGEHNNKALRLEVLAPDAGLLPALTPLAVWLQLIALDFALSTL
jgi:hypothetical protein